MRRGLVVRRTGNDVPMEAGRDVWLHELDVSDDQSTCPCEPVDAEDGGYLVLKRPWPAMLRGIFGDDARYRQTYWERFPGV